MEGRGFGGERLLWRLICCYFQVAFSWEREMEGGGPTGAVGAVCAHHPDGRAAHAADQTKAF